MLEQFNALCNDNDDGTDVHADWRRSCTYSRAPNAIYILQGS